MLKKSGNESKPFLESQGQAISHRSNNFDFLRFLGASLVIYGHAYPLSGRGTFDHIQLWTRGLFPTAHMGVAIFFVISGFLIAQSLARSPSVSNYVWKRCLRIFPGLIVAALLTVFFVGPILTDLPLNKYFTAKDTYKYLTVIKLYPPYPDTLPGVFEQATNRSVNGSLWTLAYEFSCYFALLAVSLVIAARIRGKVILGAFLAVWASFLLWYPVLSASTYRLPFFHLKLFNLIDFGMYFVAGSAAYHFKDYILYKGYIALTFFLIWMGSYLLAESLIAVPLTCVVWARYLAVPYLVLYLSFLSGPLNQFGRYGDLSYGLYIYAFPIQRIVVEKIGETAPIEEIIFLSFLFTLPFAWLSWSFIEKPCLKYKKLIT